MTPADIREWRDCMGLTQSEAATRLGVALRTWQYWEKGDRENPGLLLVRALRDVGRELAEERK